MKRDSHSFLDGGSSLEQGIVFQSPQLEFFFSVTMSQKEKHV
jgi:hypothetical protein